LQGCREGSLDDHTSQRLRRQLGIRMDTPDEEDEPDERTHPRTDDRYVVTEPVTTTVPVEREVVRVEREPITDQNVDEAIAGPEISAGEHEVALSEEEVLQSEYKGRKQ